MTNLSGSNKKKDLITPENSLLFIPIFIGLISLSSLLIFVFRPLINKLSIEEAQIELLEDKISYIPIYKKYIKKISINTSKAKQQQQRLINLISDSNQLSSILEEINNLTIKYGLDIKELALEPIIKHAGQNNNNNVANKNTNQDPFLIPSIEKHKFILTIEGDYNNLINLLKELESLQTIAIVDNIEISSIPSNNKTNKSKNKIFIINDNSNIPEITNIRSRNYNEKEQILSIRFNLITYSNTKDKTIDYKMNNN